MSQSALQLDQDNFGREILEHDGLALVDFWAGWCGPCNAIAPTIDALARDDSLQAKVGKVEVDLNQDLASTYGVQSIPTLLFFRGGLEVHRIVGITSKGVIERKLVELEGASGPSPRPAP